MKLAPATKMVMNRLNLRLGYVYEKRVLLWYLCGTSKEWCNAVVASVAHLWYLMAHS